MFVLDDERFGARCTFETLTELDAAARKLAVDWNVDADTVIDEMTEAAYEEDDPDEDAWLNGRDEGEGEGDGEGVD